MPSKRKKKLNETERNGKKKVGNNNRGQANSTDTRNVCGRYINYACRRGMNCPLEHPVICEADIYRTHCREDACDLYHPQVCYTNWRHKVCNWGADCKFRHLKEDVQDYEHRGNHLSRGQNHHRYGDDPWSNVRPNGRNQNKREPHNRNIRKNYNINGEHTYSGTYRGHNSHLNSHQGSQMNHPNRNDNQKRNYRQGPQMDHPNEKFNQDVNFLGYRQNPMDWPALTEESLLKPLRELIRAELKNWGPARQ